MKKNNQMIQWLLTEAEGKLPVGSTLLDLGPGIGIPSFHLAKAKGYKIILAELEGAPTLDFLRWRARHHGVEIDRLHIKTFTEAVPTFSCQVDALIMESMLDHCPDAYGTLTWAIAQIRPGGLLLCDYHTGSKAKHDIEPQHLITYDQFTMPHWMQEHGMVEHPKYPWMFTKKGLR
jgi:2-polyprenyl-3-methyl-5-hydroxy-6-metoxy-1,4-benzoquinol methylase